jgi:hypothetical protein
MEKLQGKSAFVVVVAYYVIRKLRICNVSQYRPQGPMLKKCMPVILKMLSVS